MDSRLQRDWFRQPTRQLAIELLGKTLLRRLSDDICLRATIVEVEAYLAERDPASHSWRGLKKSNRSMFSQPGSLYVYPIHSRHCMNVVTEPRTVGAAVLIRAVEPLCGCAAMWELRFQSAPPERWNWRDLASLTQGPGKLCEALSVDRGLDGIDLCSSSEVWLEAAHPRVEAFKWRAQCSPRINVSAAKSRKLRWFIDGNRFVSGKASDHSQGRRWEFHEAHRLPASDSYPSTLNQITTSGRRE